MSLSTYKTQLADGRMLQIEDTELERFAKDVGLDNIAPGRYSLLFVFKFVLYTTIEGIEANFILQELKRLEGLSHDAIETKAPTQFSKEPLKGLWHQHFFSARFIPKNIASHMPPKKVEATVKRIFDAAESPVVTKEMIHELASALTHGAMEERASQKKLTGEWIVFAKHDKKNYYLTLTVHPTDRTTGDQAIFDEINDMAFAQFPFLMRN
ncbi:hypothetical protein [Dyella nitratireducens]|uniref:Uncharacterized protein n=1 Tax=Dyella nitratireducens TaxID=1849580 RepID=A0ABQ1FN99_9GAMM|nr:hypothetical protein [Dyella nitratireducens]GGA21883.1 hypothetical protein GCM10010981_07540 [Dyella nitratireducens]GLQ44185.1 hypothetical protein GCM10007902_40350 [Dyella nitratireducens]